MGEEFHAFLRFCKDRLPAGSTFRLVGIDYASIDKVRAFYFLYPSLVAEHAQFILVYRTPAHREDNTHAYARLNEGSFILRSTRPPHSMTDIFLGLASLAPVILVGYFLVLAMDHHGILRPVERLALGYGIGTGLLTWEMLVFQTLGFSFTVIGLLAPLLGFSAIAFLFARRHPLREGRPESRLAFPSVPFQRVEWFLIAAIVIETSGCILPRLASAHGSL